MDKRSIATTFSERLKLLVERRGESVSSFARRCNLDRSALSQFLDKNLVRLPRAETLSAIAVAEGVSIDWLMGMRQDEQNFGEVASLLNIEKTAPGSHDSVLSGWQKEAIGYKIRYSPSSIPDLLRTKAVIDYEFDVGARTVAEIKADVARQQLDYSRLPETDMEAIMPFQRLETMAYGADIWSDLARGARQAQLDHIARLLDELYPTFRIFLYDGRTHYSAPFTVFGPKRAAIYIGDMYLVVNSVDHIRELTKQFDSIIRVATISPDRAAEWISGLKVI